jgi:hypothetical protein
MVDDRERPIAVGDIDIDKIQAMQFSYVPQPIKPQRKRYKAKGQDEAKGIITISTRSFWHMDGNTRTGLLDKALQVHECTTP